MLLFRGAFRYSFFVFVVCLRRIFDAKLKSTKPPPPEYGLASCHFATSPLKFLLVRPTGGGKTLVFTSIVACIKGITLCITPLLSLGADQVQKIMLKTFETDKSIVGFHLDELTDAKLG